MTEPAIGETPWEPDKACPTFDVVWTGRARDGEVMPPTVRCRVCQEASQLSVSTTLNDFFNLLGKHFHARSGHYLVLHNRRGEEGP